MNYQLVKQVRENNPLRKSFIDLAVKTFDLSFEEWYQQGYWTDAYIPTPLSNVIKLSLTPRPTSSICAGRASPGGIFRLVP